MSQINKQIKRKAIVNIKELMRVNNIKLSELMKSFEDFPEEQ